MTLVEAEFIETFCCCSQDEDVDYADDEFELQNQSFEHVYSELSAIRDKLKVIFICVRGSK